MADDTNLTPVSAPPAPAPSVVIATPVLAPVAMSVDEFCLRLSSTDKRVEMISAFHSGERASGRSMDLETAFAVRYAAFCNAPA